MFRVRLSPSVAALVVAFFCAASDGQESRSGSAIEDPDRAHAELFFAERFPSARACGECHPKHFEEWSTSQHAYAQLSPVFNAMQGVLLQQTNGTLGDFCIRCHTPVGMTLGEPQFMSNLDRHPVSREGVTCIVCHRMSESYSKVSSRIALREGDITQPVRGPRGDNSELERILEEGGVSSDPDDAGRKVHGKIDRFFHLTKPTFCGTCHDVTLVDGFRLEEAFAEYRNSPAAEEGITCQDCHMGKEPGKALAEKDDPAFESKNYDFGPAAVVGGLETEPRKLTSHRFVGPDHTVLPPALFPVRAELIREEGEEGPGLATLREWIQFDTKAGWGTDEFEDQVTEEDEEKFPERWASVDDRYEARELIEENLEKLEHVAGLRLQLLRNGYELGEIDVDDSSEPGLRFSVEVKNATDGHNVPTGFDAERIVWLNVEVLDANDRIVFQSGDLDPAGDLRDLHSLYVHDHVLPLDDQLFNLQSKFITRNIRGGEREQILSVNFSASPLPFVRPERRSSVLQGGPNGARKHKKAIEPGGHRIARYEVKEELLSGHPPYRATIRLKAGMVPVNLIRTIQGVGFDYGLSARDVAEAVVAGHQVLWEREIEFDTDGKAR